MLIDIHQLIELFISECYFLWSNIIWDLLNLRRTGLSIMVLLSESYLQNCKKHATELALTFGLAPETFCRYASDSHV